MSHGLKDKFAADAMTALLARDCVRGFCLEQDEISAIAVEAYDIAEAMLAERARRYSAHSAKEAAE